jgi:hypothetical protein
MPSRRATRLHSWTSSPQGRCLPQGVLTRYSTVWIMPTSSLCLAGWLMNVSMRVGSSHRDGEVTARSGVCGARPGFSFEPRPDRTVTNTVTNRREMQRHCRALPGVSVDSSEAKRTVTVLQLPPSPHPNPSSRKPMSRRQTQARRSGLMLSAYRKRIACLGTECPGETIGLPAIARCAPKSRARAMIAARMTFQLPRRNSANRFASD